MLFVFLLCLLSAVTAQVTCTDGTAPPVPVSVDFPAAVTVNRGQSFAVVVDNETSPFVDDVTPPAGVTFTGCFTDADNASTFVFAVSGSAAVGTRNIVFSVNSTNENVAVTIRAVTTTTATTTRAPTPTPTPSPTPSPTPLTPSPTPGGTTCGNIPGVPVPPGRVLFPELCPSTTRATTKVTTKAPSAAKTSAPTKKNAAGATTTTAKPLPPNIFPVLGGGTSKPANTPAPTSSAGNLLAGKKTTTTTKKPTTKKPTTKKPTKKPTTTKKPTKKPTKLPTPLGRRVLP